MHLAKGAWRHLVLAIALVALALPLATSVATPAAHAQSVGQGLPSASLTTSGGSCASATSATCYFNASPRLAFNPIGEAHTVSFTCGPAVAGLTGGRLNAAVATLAAGCYNVTGTVTDETTGDAVTIAFAHCANNATTVSGSSVNCASYASPLCPPGTFTNVNAPGAPCNAANPAGNATLGSTVGLTINPGAPHSYLIQFSGYTPLLAACASNATANGGTGTCQTAGGAATAACPAGTTYVAGPFTVSEALGTPPVETQVTAPDGVCHFVVSAEKKYYEITGVTLTGTGPCASGAGPSPLLFAEGLKAFFGTPCFATASVNGIVVLKTGVDCTAEPPAVSSAGPIGFPNLPSVTVGGLTYPAVTSAYQCINGTLSVKITGIVPNGPAALANNGFTFGPVVITVSGTNAGITAGIPAPTLGAGACAGTSTGSFSTLAGSIFVICPVGPGAGNIKACIVAGPDSQPTVCSAAINFVFTVPTQQRVVPLVRWAGEKQVLTKCFGGAGLFGGALVEFTLESNSNAQATLLPASGPGITGGPTGSVPVTAPTADTVITQADVNGCATVIVYAADEGVVNVDAAIYSNNLTPGIGTTALLNEHAFEIFYLKFDHVDLENIKMTTTTANPFTQLGFTAVPAGFNSIKTAASYALPSAPGANLPSAGGFFSVPLCGTDFMRALVHGYFEYPGDPSTRPAAAVPIPGAAGNAGYTLPAGRWVLPEDWPLLATFAGFNGTTPVDTAPSSVYSFDLNSGWVFHPGDTGNAAELPVICAGLNGTLATVYSGPIGNGPGEQVSYGPCYGQDFAEKSAGNVSNGNFYDTAPDGVPGDNFCQNGITVGIGPFDPTQTCVNGPGGSFPLAEQPSGGSILVPNGAGTGFNIQPLSANSTYLPNGTVNEWDAPMPPAQLSFQLLSGPGFLGQVNKSSLYRIPTLDSNGNLNGFVYPDPFYAEAIPASPLIPAVANDGGYLWNTFGNAASTGYLTDLGSLTAAGFVAGESDLVANVQNINGACSENNVSNGFTLVTGGSGFNGVCFVGTGGVADTTVTQAECNELGGTFSVVTPANGVLPAEGTCQIPAAANPGNPGANINGNGTAPGGINLTNFGPGCPGSAGTTNVPSNSFQVVVANANGFVPGMTVEVYSTHDGHTILQGLQLVNVGPAPTGPGGAVQYPGNAGTLFFSDSLSGTGTIPSICIPVFQGVFVSEQVRLNVAPFTNANVVPGATITITTPNNTGANATVAFPAPKATANVPASYPVDQANGVIYVDSAENLARILGGCVLSRGPIGGPVVFGACEPSDWLPAGSVLNGGVSSLNVVQASDLFTGQGPYPFWQFIPGPSSGSTSTKTATMYTDNHGEAVVALQTGVASQVLPTLVGGVPTCPANYTLTPGNTNCLLNLAVVGTAAGSASGVAFQNVAAAQAAFNAGTPGCLNTSGTTTTPAPAATVAVSGTGPTSGQICVNSLGGIEFGTGAVLGTTTIQAIADYPYYRLHPAVSSGVITKIFTSAFAKTLTVSPLPSGIPGPNGTTTYTVTISATDICGNAIVGEPVNVFALTGAAGAVVLAPQGTNAVSNGTTAATVFLDATGKATLSLEVLGSALGNSGLVVKAVFPFEKIERFVTVVAGTSSPTTTTVLYGPGYNMVGGPAGTNFGAAEAVFSFSPTSNTYSTATATSVSSAAPSCTGYFAYFANPASVNITVSSKAGDTAACSLAAGWNLVGNPFGSPAALPAGTTAYHFNPSTQAYDVVSTIPVGGAVFIFEAAATTLTLTAT